SKSTLADAITRFGASRILSPMAITEEVLRHQAQGDLNNHISSAQTTFALILLAIRQTMAGNQYISALGTNFYLRYPPSTFGNWDHPKMLPVVFENCSCLSISGCPRPALIKDSRDQLVVVPGMIVDCYVVDSTLGSTLECYYDLTCFRLLHKQSIETVSLLSDYSNNHFLVNSTVQTLLDDLMIDKLNSEIMFDSFYSQCKPDYCAFSYTHRFSRLFIITTILGTFGALSSILRLMTPFIVKIIFRWKTKIASNDTIPQNDTVILRKRK
ncbi:unnamed protein product, partial [Rotaria sp. Silwood2]